MPSIFELLRATLIFQVALPFLTSGVCAAAGLWLCTLPLRRLPANAHWSEVARTYWPQRSAASLIAIWLLTVACVSLESGTTVMSVIATGISVIAGCLCGFRLARWGQPLPAGTVQPRLATLPARWLLFPAIPATLLLIALTLREGIHFKAIALAGIVVVGVLVLIAGGSAAILKACGVLRPADHATQQLAQELAAAENVPLRSVLRMDLGMANAFAFGWSRELGITDTALAILTPDELRSVMAHEIGHLRENLSTRLQRLIGVPGIGLLGLAPAAAVNLQPLVALGLFLGYVALSRLATRHYRQLELAADSHAYAAVADDGVYARALEKIHRASLIPAVLAVRHPYPSLYDRMLAAGVTPDFPHPAPPSQRLALVISGATAIVFFLLQQEAGVLALAWWAVDH
jgi:Zn-dependent protease with chaperone function